MSKVKFEAYLESQGALLKNQEEIIDWENKKVEWINQVKVLFGHIKGYFVRYENSVSIEEKTLSINEEYIGHYTIPQLVVKFNNDTVTFTPIGRNIIGAQGRVDMEGKAGRVKFVLVREIDNSPQVVVSVIGEEKQKNHDEGQKILSKDYSQDKYTWKISTPPPKINYIDLNESSFFEALIEVING